MPQQPDHHKKSLPGKRGASGNHPRQGHAVHRGAKRGGSGRGRSSNDIGVRRIRGGSGWLLVHPRSVRDRSEDLEEVEEMVAAGEIDIAIDELRWLLADCSEMISAHFLLGKLAVEADQDLPLARAHFGFGYELGLRALRRGKMPSPLSAEHPANQPFYDAGRGLAWCLHALNKPAMAVEVIEQLLACDPEDPLGLGSWIDEIKLGRKALVGIDEALRAGP